MIYLPSEVHQLLEKISASTPLLIILLSDPSSTLKLIRNVSQRRQQPLSRRGHRILRIVTYHLIKEI